MQPSGRTSLAADAMKSKTSKPPGTKRGARPATRAIEGRAFRCVISQKQIKKRVGELARQIDRDYQGTTTLHVVGILEDSFIFVADLIRNLTIPVVCHFMNAVMHDTLTGPIAMREIKYSPEVDAKGRDVLLVNGILHSGVTLDYVYRYILGQSPTSVRTLSFIEISRARKVDVSTDYVGFTSKEGFLVGYGLGYGDKYRNLPFVARLAGAV
jgi:hypoxanthine phosphoribosyltransferase